MGERNLGPVGLIGTVKDEGPWLIEWVAHYKNLGFDRIAMSSNDCSDGTDRILDRMQEMGLLIHVPNPGPYRLPIQQQAYRRLQDLPQMKSCEWLMTLDVDEFLCVHVGNGTVQDLLKRTADADQVPIRWRLFGDSSLSGIVPPPVTEAFINSEPNFEAPDFIKLEDTSAYKTLVRSHRKYWMSIHYSTTLRPWSRFSLERFRKKTFYGGGRVIEIAPKLRQKQIAQKIDIAGGNVELAEVNHYAVKTREICALKQKRGDAGRPGNVQGDDVYFNRWNRNEIQNTAIGKYSVAVNSLCKTWLDDEELRELHNKSIEILNQRIQNGVDGVDTPIQRHRNVPEW